MGNIIGIDLGGTSIDGGRIEQGNILLREKADTQASAGGETTLRVLKGVIATLVDRDTQAIGIGVPSVVDQKKGIVYNVQNIAGWDEVPLKRILEAEFGLPVYIDNDANCFASGELVFGKGRGLESFVGVTLGTGVGAGLILDGKLVPGVNCGSGEFGELPYLDGKLEDYCGSRFFTQKVGTPGVELSRRALEGDAEALAHFRTYGSHLSYLVRVIVLTLDPQAVIFGGSIARSFDLFREAIQEGLRDFPYPKSIEKLQILCSETNHSGILGAGSLCVGR